MSIRMTILLLFVLFMVGATALVLYLQPKPEIVTTTKIFLYKVSDIEAIKSVSLEQSKIHEKFNYLKEKFPLSDGTFQETSSWVFEDKLHAVDPKQFGGSTVLLSEPEAYSIVAEEVENIEQYGFDDSQLTITLHFNDNPKDDLIFYLGGSSLEGDFVYARLKDSKKVFTIVSDWKSVFAKYLTQRPYLKLLNIQLDRLTEITISTIESKTRLKKENENWVNEKSLINPALISSLQPHFNNEKVFRKIQRHYGPLKYGLGKAQKTTIEFKEGKKTTTINLGSIILNNKYQYAEIAGDAEENLYLISVSFGKSFLELIN